MNNLSPTEMKYFSGGFLHVWLIILSVCKACVFARIVGGEAEAILYNWVSNTFDTHII